MIRTYFQMLIEEELPDAVGKMKQFASWFTHGVPGGAGLRKAIYESKSAVEILGRVEEFFEARLCGAGALARKRLRRSSSPRNFVPISSDPEWTPQFLPPRRPAPPLFDFHEACTRKEHAPAWR